MKKLLLSFAMIALAAILLVTACKKSNDKLVTEEQTSMSSSRAEADDDQGLLAAFFKRNGPQPKTYEIDASREATIDLPSGGKINIPVGAFAIGGRPIRNGKVAVTVLDLPNRAAIALTGTNTMLGEELLESNGNFKLDAAVNGQNVDKELAKPVKVEVPDRGKDGKPLNLFEGFINDQRQFDWKPAKVPGQAADIPVSGGSYTFSWPSTGWCNPDWLVAGPLGATTLQVDLPNNPGPLSYYQGGNGSTAVLLAPKGQNMIIHVYTSNLPDGVISYPNSIPIGMECRLLAYSVTSSGYFMATKDITITSANPMVESLTFTTCSENDLTTALTNLSGYN